MLQMHGLKLFIETQKAVSIFLEKKVWTKEGKEEKEINTF